MTLATKWLYTEDSEMFLLCGCCQRSTTSFATNTAIVSVSDERNDVVVVVKVNHSSCYYNAMVSASRGGDVAVIVVVVVKINHSSCYHNAMTSASRGGDVAVIVVVVVAVKINHSSCYSVWLWCQP